MSDIKVHLQMNFTMVRYCYYVTADFEKGHKVKLYLWIYK